MPLKLELAHNFISTTSRHKGYAVATLRLAPQDAFAKVGFAHVEGRVTQPLLVIFDRGDALAHRSRSLRWSNRTRGLELQRPGRLPTGSDQNAPFAIANERQLPPVAVVYGECDQDQIGGRMGSKGVSHARKALKRGAVGLAVISISMPAHSKPVHKVCGEVQSRAATPALAKVSSWE